MRLLTGSKLGGEITVSDLDGKQVTFAKGKDWRGKVVGDSYIPGCVRVEWIEPEKFTGVQRLTDLECVE